MATALNRYDLADYLRSDEDIAAYLEACAEEEDPALLTHASGAIARARTISQLTRDTGMTREGLYKALSANGNPSFSTIAKVSKALGLKISISPLGSS